MINLKALKSAKSTKITITRVNEIVDGSYVKELRKRLNVSQVVFATIMNVSKKTVEAWEEGRNPIKGGAAVAIYLLNKHIGLSRDLIEMELPENEKADAFPFATSVKYFNCNFYDEDQKYIEELRPVKYVIQNRKNTKNNKQIGGVIV